MTVTERDLDILAESTNGNCGLVLLMRKHNQKPAPDLDMISHEETIETEVDFTYPSISQILNNFNQTFDKKLFMNKLSVRNEQIKYVESATRQQNNSSLWYKFRYGRITASNFKEVICKVSDEFNVINPLKLKTIISKICDEPKRINSKALEWGVTNEAIARQSYRKISKKKHKGLQVFESGFFISKDYPFIGASPDGLVECSCHHKGLLEIKCPFTYRGLSIREYASKAQSCLIIENQTIKLKRNHPYYYQVQCQMGVTERSWCDFFVITTKDYFCEMVHFDANFWETCAKKAFVLYDYKIIDTLFEKHIEKECKFVLDKIVGSLL